jgi:hypothetical protein
MAITHDLIAKTGEYKNANGETKARWTKVGVAMSNKQGGTSLLIESIPVNFDGWVTMREPQPKDGANSSASAPEGDMPF